MKKYFEIIKKCRLFENISEENFSEMLNCLDAAIRTYKKNQTIISEGSEIRQIGIALSGTVQISRLDYHGNRNIVSSITASELFGESFVCAEVGAASINAAAAEDCTIMFISGSKILNSCGNACEFHSRLIHNLVKILAEKNLMFNRKIEIISQKTTREKLMTYLTQQARLHGSDFKIPYNRQELADFLGVDRSGLSVEIGKLRNENVLECQKNKFRLC